MIVLETLRFLNTIFLSDNVLYELQPSKPLWEETDPSLVN